MSDNIHSYKVGTNTHIYNGVTIICDEEHHVTIGDNCLIGDGVKIYARNFVMKDGSQLAPGVTVCGGGDVTLGENCSVGFNAILIPATDTSRAQFMNEASKIEKRKVVHGSIMIGEGAYIGSGAIICVSEKCVDILIGKYSVIGAGSYIDKSVQANTKIIPRMKYDITPRFKCIMTGRAKECLMDDCSINSGNWYNCGYHPKEK